MCNAGRCMRSLLAARLVPGLRFECVGLWPTAGGTNRSSKPLAPCKVSKNGRMCAAQRKKFVGFHCFISRLQILLLLRGKMHGGARVRPEGAIVDSSASSAAKPSSVLSSAHKQMATSVRRHEFCCVRTLSWRAQGSPTLLLVPCGEMCCVRFACVANDLLR